MLVNQACDVLLPVLTAYNHDNDHKQWNRKSKKYIRDDSILPMLMLFLINKRTGASYATLQPGLLLYN
jgi:hypothetical protein